MKKGGRKVYKRLAMGGPYADPNTPQYYDKFQQQKGSAQATSDAAGNAVSSVASNLGPWGKLIGTGVTLAHTGQRTVDGMADDRDGLQKTGIGNAALVGIGNSIDPTTSVIKGFKDLGNKDLGIGYKAMNFVPGLSGITQGHLASQAREKLQADRLMSGYKNFLNTSRGVGENYNMLGNQDAENYKNGGKLHKMAGGGNTPLPKFSYSERQLLGNNKVNGNYDKELYHKLIGYTPKYTNPTSGSKEWEYENNAFNSAVDKFNTSDPTKRQINVGSFRGINDDNALNGAINRPQDNKKLDDYVSSNSQYANGGTLKTMSDENSEVVGKSHDQGGVKFPQAGVELEGGETMNNDFVFSKELGFAQKHKPLARAIGRVENKPQTSITRNTLNRLKKREQQLKVDQEQTKQALGISSDLDNKAMGGRIYKKMGTGGKPWLTNYDGSVDADVPQNGGMQQLSYRTASGGSMIAPTAKTAGVSVPSMSGGGEGESSAPGWVGAASNIAPFADNLFNYAQNRQRAKQDIPQEDTIRPITPNLVDYSASRAEADRQRLNLNKNINQYSSNGATANSNRGEALVNTISAKNQINQDEANTNSEIKGRTSAINSQIQGENNKTVLSNQLRKLLAKDDIRREDSSNVANATSKFSRIADRNYDKDIEKQQQKIDLSSVDPKTLSVLLKKNPQLAREYYNKKMGGSLRRKLVY